MKYVRYFVAVSAALVLSANIALAQNDDFGDLEGELDALEADEFEGESSIQDEGFEDFGDFGGKDSEESFEDFNEADFAEEFSDDNFNDSDFETEEFSFDEFEEPEQTLPPTAPADELEFAEDPQEIDAKPVSESEEDEGLVELYDKSKEPPMPENASEPPAAESFVEVTPPEPRLDEPDHIYEAKLHSIYVNFLSEKTSDQEWASLVGARQAEIYVIQSGDTLWDISQTFFGSGNYWPKIWALNGEIANPHEIEPGNQIRFVLGDMGEPPAFSVSKASEVPEPEVSLKDQVTAKKSQEPEVLIPPPTIVSAPVLKKLPPSFPVWQDADSGGNYDDVGIEYARRPILDLKDEVWLDSYITDKEPAVDGEIVELEQEGYIAKPSQMVYLWMKRGVANIGQEYLVVNSLGPLQRVHRVIKDENLGVAVEVKGELRLLEQVASKREKEGYELFRAVITRSINPIQVGNEVLQGSIPRIDFSDKGPRSNVVAQIIGGKFDNRKQLAGPQSIVYLNRGAADGLEVGQILPIRANRELNVEDSVVVENISNKGWLKIVNTADKFSTAVVVRAWEEVASGDLTGKGQLLPSTAREAEATEFGETGQPTEVEGPGISDEDFGPAEAELDTESFEGEFEEFEGENFDDF